MKETRYLVKSFIPSLLAHSYKRCIESPGAPLQPIICTMKGDAYYPQFEENGAGHQSICLGCPDKYSDVLHGLDLIEAFRDGRVTENDIVPMFSVDSAQHYAKKASACWIYIWVVARLSDALVSPGRREIREIWMRKGKVGTEASKEYAQWLGGSNRRESLADRLRGKRGKRRRKRPETTAHKLDQKTGTMY
jgi:hypothetical protein